MRIRIWLGHSVSVHLQRGTEIHRVGRKLTRPELLDYMLSAVKLVVPTRSLVRLAENSDGQDIRTVFCFKRLWASCEINEMI
jgi:hypothetical protein